MAIAVNLDALIPREDFEAVSANDDAKAPLTITVRDLEPAAFFSFALRKPDFQRETSEWDAQRVAGLIKTFIEGDLIPAVILWKHRNNLFVIDGCHRLSALIAWVQDDYGDGTRSQEFFGHSIPSEQIAYADRTRKIIEGEIGSYADHVAAVRNPGGFGPDVVARSKLLGSRVLDLQWVRGDVIKAEASFARINQQAATITAKEIDLIKKRRRPNVMAARSIIRKGTGYQYWSSFSEPVQNQLRRLASECHRLLFDPELSYPIKSLSLPAGGSVYASSTLQMFYDFVNLSVGTVNDADDVTGDRTVDTLRRTKRVLELIISNSAGSLGLHPAVYFYSWTGKQQPILLLTISGILIEYDRNRKINKFANIRSSLEKFIINHRTLFNQIVRKFGTKDSGRNHLTAFYELLFEKLEEGLSDETVVESLVSHKDYTYLQPSESPYAGVSPTKYSAQVKSGVIISELLPAAPKCAICGGLVPPQAISIDHKRARSEGGKSNLENLQVTHPYCNTGIKEATKNKTSKSV